MGNRNLWCTLPRWGNGFGNMDVLTITTQHLVKSEDLNHHGTLYAGRSAEWFVEAGFITAASVRPPEHILCVKIHGLEFIRPVQKGEIVRYTGKLVLAGRTSLFVHVAATVQDKTALEGFLTFVHVDDQGKPQEHGLTITAQTAEDQALQERARALKTK